jgi:hypothetical protein
MTYQWIASDVVTPIVELRRYRLHHGRRDELIELFEDRFIESQEAVGARVLGTFRVAEEPDTFLWLRAFSHMAARRHALEAFYGGPVWRFHRDAANATMIDSNDVHLLRAIAPETGVQLPPRRPAPGERRPAQSFRLMVSELRYAEGLGSYHLWLRLFLRKAGADPLASFGTLPAENNYPALPVWRNRPVHVALIAGDAVVPPLPDELAGMLRGAQEVLTLQPTARSLVR